MNAISRVVGAVCVVLVPLLAAASCSDSSANGPVEDAASANDAAPGSSNDGALASEAASDGAPTSSDARVDSTNAVDAAVDAIDSAPPACTDLVDLSAGVTPVKKSGSAPVAASGAFAGGTYVLTKVEYWGGTLSGTWHGTYRFSGNGYEYADGNYTEQGDVIFSSGNANQWTQRIDCPVQSGSPWLLYFFSASGNEFVLHTEAPDGPRLRTFTRVISDAGDGG